MPGRRRRFLYGSMCGGLLVAILSALNGGAQTSTPNEWTWQAGDPNLPIQTEVQPTVWGTEGVFAPGNSPGGRLDGATWTDKNGKFWLYANGLWEFDPTLKEWAWIAGAGPFADEGEDPNSINGVYGTMGVAAAGQHPGLRSGSATWTDSQGMLWLFGGFGYGSDAAQQMIELNDLWRFDPSNKEWTWMGGSETGLFPAQYGMQGVAAAGNIPGGRSDATTWMDSSGRFWLYGGIGWGANNSTGVTGNLSDLWMYDPSSSEWTWVSGSEDDTGQVVTPAVYGMLGVPAPGNTPGSRMWSSSWTDKAGNLWLFGGLEEPNDVWKFDPGAGQWTWMGGSDTVTEGQCAGSTSTPCAERGIYGTLGVPAAGNVPGQRQYAMAWTDQNGEFWLYGGQGEDSMGDVGLLNDLWRFDASTNEWAWMGGTSVMPCSVTNYGYTCRTLPVPGTEGIAAPVNSPGGRYFAPKWLDNNGNLWLMGGLSSVPDGNVQSATDMWELTPSVSSLPPAITPIFSPPSGNYQSDQTVTIFNGMSNANIYYTTDGTLPTSGSSTYTGPISVTGTETLEAIAASPGYPASGLATAVYGFKSDTPTFSQPSGTYLSAIQVTISDTTSGARIYYTTDGTTPTSNSTQMLGSPIQVTTSETIKAIAIANGYSSDVASASYILNISPPSFSLSAQPDGLAVPAGSAGSVTLMVTPQYGFNATVSFACSGLPAGATCGFNPATVTPTYGVATTTLTITTAEKTSALRPGAQTGWPAALAFGVCFLGWKRRRGAMRWLVLLAAVVGLGMISACGGGGSSGGGGGGGTTSQTSTVTVTATSGTLKATTPIALTVD